MDTMRLGNNIDYKNCFEQLGGIVGAGNAFLEALFGGDAFTQWKCMKKCLGFNCDQLFVEWLLHLAQDTVNKHPYGTKKGKVGEIFKKRKKSKLKLSKLSHPTIDSFRSIGSQTSNLHQDENLQKENSARTNHHISDEYCEDQSQLHNEIPSSKPNRPRGEEEINHPQQSLQHQNPCNETQRSADGGVVVQGIKNLPIFTSEGAVIGHFQGLDMPAEIQNAAQGLNEIPPGVPSGLVLEFESRNNGLSDKQNTPVELNKKNTSGRPFKCKHCPKAFKHKHHLTDHVRSHTGERPYKCPLCGDPFRRGFSLNKHISKHRMTSQQSRRDVVQSLMVLADSGPTSSSGVSGGQANLSSPAHPVMFPQAVETGQQADERVGGTLGDQPNVTVHSLHGQHLQLSANHARGGEIRPDTTGARRTAATQQQQNQAAHHHHTLLQHHHHHQHLVAQAPPPPPPPLTIDLHPYTVVSGGGAGGPSPALAISLASEHHQAGQQHDQHHQVLLHSQGQIHEAVVSDCGGGVHTMTTLAPTPLPTSESYKLFGK